MERKDLNPKPDIAELVNRRGLDQAREQLEKLGNYWIGPDVKMSGRIAMPPSSAAVNEVKLIVNKKDFPPVNLTREALLMMNWSTRSCLAQVGIEFIYDPTWITDEMIRDLNDGKNISLPVWVNNHSDRPVAIEGDVMRFFWTNEANRLRGDALQEVIRLGMFKIDGDGSVVSERETCVKIPLEHKFYIPASNEVVRVTKKDDLPHILQEISGDQNPNFKIGETARVRLGPGIIGVINWGMDEKGQIHTHSPLIDSGYEGPIRTKTLNGLDAIELFLYTK